MNYFKNKIKTLSVNLLAFYKKIACDRIRNSCRFEPTCSNYMILSIIKYGTAKGIIMGIKRILRCHPPNGGKDYP